MKIRFKGKGIIGIILASGLAWIFALFLSGRVGYLMAFTIILAPVVSFILSYIFAKSIEVTVDIEDGILSKRDRTSYSITVRNSALLPTPPILITLYDSPVVRSKEKKYLVSVMPKHDTVIDVDLYARFCGPAMVGVSKVEFTDFLGIFEFELTDLKYEELKANLGVIPEVNDISLNDENIMKIISASRHSDESDETVEAEINTFSGFPGYNSRDYIPGDPLKRINWKQSAKRGKLLVRLDDEMSSSTINIVLDSVIDTKPLDLKELRMRPEYEFYEEDEIIPAIVQETIENALGIMRLLVNNNYTVTFFAKGSADYVNYHVDDEASLEYVRIELATVGMKDNSEGSRFPGGYDAQNVSVFVTPVEDPYTYDILGLFTDISKVIMYPTLSFDNIKGGAPNEK